MPFFLDARLLITHSAGSTYVALSASSTPKSRQTRLATDCVLLSGRRSQLLLAVNLRGLLMRRSRPLASVACSTQHGDY